MKLSRCSIRVAALLAAPLALVVAPFVLASQAHAAELTLPRDGWASWEVPAVEEAPAWCCWTWKGNKIDELRKPCRLDRDSDGFGSRNQETTDAVRVYARMASGKVDRLHVFAAACPVQAATPITDLGDVVADDSARWLTDLAKHARGEPDEHHDIGEKALAALAIHRGKLAGDALAAMARSDASDETRKQAVFWLAQVRGAEGAQITSFVMFNDEDPDVREHAAFSLSQSEAPRVAAELIRLGNTDQDDNVRAQAWFWLAQTGAAEAEAAIVAALKKDTDDNVREQAIFALSQLPDERATQALIAAAEDRSLAREERKRAIFWLSQAHTDAAQEYLSKVLAGGATD